MNIPEGYRSENVIDSRGASTEIIEVEVSSTVLYREEPFSVTELVLDIVSSDVALFAGALLVVVGIWSAMRADKNISL